MADPASAADAPTEFDSPSETSSRDRWNSSELRNVRGAVYLPQKDWNAYQLWANYDEAVVERELGYAARLGVNSLRVWSSYEFWREDATKCFERTEEFLSTCEHYDIRPVFVLFEAPPKRPPTKQNLHSTDPKSAFGVHSPSRSEILRKRNWKGYDGSPIQFARRWANEFATDPRVLATEIMNEPGDVQPRKRFVFDALDAVREAAPDATLTMGTKDVRYAKVYDRNDDLDVYQFHMNLPKDPTEAELYIARQRALTDQPEDTHDDTDTKKPLWCTEWQRTLEEPPSRFAPNLASLAPTIRAATDVGTLDGDFFWSLMLKPAYLRTPREHGRINGLFHEDGAVFSKADAAAVATSNSEADGFAALSGASGGVPASGLDDFDVPERHELPSSWLSHPFPYPEIESRATEFGASDAADSAGKSNLITQSDEERESFLNRLLDVLNFRRKR